MLTFLLGLFIGSTFGILAAALAAVASKGERQ